MSVLSAMITPAVLISACASLVISTANRLGRAIDRTRKLLERFEQISVHRHAPDSEQPVSESPHDNDEATLLFEQLSLATERSRLLHRALAALYMALSIFVATSVALGFSVLGDERLAWMPLLLGIIGAALLFYTTVLLILETLVARRAIYDEMDFALRRTRLHASPEMLEHQQRQRRNLLNLLR